MMIQSKRYQDLVAFAAKPAANASGEQRRSEVPDRGRLF